MLILVEGADGSGKTTLVESLRKRGFKVVKPIDRELSSQDVRWTYLCLDSVQGGMTNHIVDRSFISELVYRTFDGKEPTISLISICILLKHCKIIYCKTDSQYEDSIARGEDNITTKEASEQISKLYDLFIEMFKQFEKVPVFYYDWRRSNLDEVSVFIKSKNQRR